MTIKKVLIEVVHDEFDFKRVKGHRLKEAGEYLIELSKTLPPDTIIDEDWVDYDINEMKVVSYREETDEEFERRKAILKEKEELEARIKQQNKEREERRQEYFRLKREFG